MSSELSTELWRNAPGPAAADTAAAGGDVPVPGSVVGLLAAQFSRQGPVSPLVASLLEWHSGATGLTVIAEVSTDPDTVDALAGEDVWCSFSTPAESLIVVAAIARPLPDAKDKLELTGVRMLAYETRRRSARAGLARPARLRAGGLTHEATTLDLSRGGCRLFTLDPGDPRDPWAPGNLSEGYALEVEVELTDGQVLEAEALVIRADGPELALRFTSLEAREAAVLDAAVFRELVRSSG